jgi:hypothetical protein
MSAYLSFLKELAVLLPLASMPIFLSIKQNPDDATVFSMDNWMHTHQN